MAEHRMDGDAPKEDPTPATAPDNVEVVNGEARVKDVQGEGGDSGENLLAGKYKSVEELEKAYGELQRKLGSQTAPDSQDPPPADADDGADGLIINRSSGDEPTAEGLIAEALQAGEDLPLDKLKKMGVSESAANLIKQGIEAESSRFRSELYRVVEGKENYGPISEWAAQNVDAEELEAYNEAVTTGNLPTARLLLRGIRAAYEAAEGSTEPIRVRGQNTPKVTGVKPYASQAEMIADMNNPKYAEDPAFRAEVMERLRVSTVV